MMIVGSYPMPYMDHYDHDHPLLKADFGAPVGAAVVNGSSCWMMRVLCEISLHEKMLPSHLLVTGLPTRPGPVWSRSKTRKTRNLLTRWAMLSQANARSTQPLSRSSMVRRISPRVGTDC